MAVTFRLIIKGIPLNSEEVEMNDPKNQRSQPTRNKNHGLIVLRGNDAAADKKTKKIAITDENGLKLASKKNAAGCSFIESLNALADQIEADVNMLLKL
jgi:hypothetical protein